MAYLVVGITACFIGLLFVLCDLDKLRRLIAAHFTETIQEGRSETSQTDENESVEPKTAKKKQLLLSNGTALSGTFDDDAEIIEGKLEAISYFPGDSETNPFETYVLEKDNGERVPVYCVMTTYFSEKDIGKTVWAVVVYESADEDDTDDGYSIQKAGTWGIRSGKCRSCGAELGNMKSFCEYCGSRN